MPADFLAGVSVPTGKKDLSSAPTPEEAGEEVEDQDYPSGGTAESLAVIDMDAQDGIMPS